jgi:hypothetical protein
MVVLEFGILEEIYYFNIFSYGFLFPSQEIIRDGIFFLEEVVQKNFCFFSFKKSSKKKIKISKCDPLGQSVEEKKKKKKLILLSTLMIHHYCFMFY